MTEKNAASAAAETTGAKRTCPKCGCDGVREYSGLNPKTGLPWILCLSQMCGYTDKPYTYLRETG
jgi:hypothetical protein